jgi:hypothetical protein
MPTPPIDPQLWLALDVPDDAHTEQYLKLCSKYRREPKSADRVSNSGPLFSSPLRDPDHARQVISGR